MKFRLHLLALVFLFLSQSVLAHKDNSDKENAFKPVESLFEAMSQVDHNKMKTTVTQDFILLENGEVWSIDDLINVIEASEYKRTNYFSIISSQLKGNITLINYWNKANFSNGKDSEDVVWLESVVVFKQEGKWVLSQMHSTKLKTEKHPKNIDYKPSAK